MKTCTCDLCRRWVHIAEAKLFPLSLEVLLQCCAGTAFALPGTFGFPFGEPVVGDEPSKGRFFDTLWAVFLISK